MQVITGRGFIKNIHLTDAEIADIISMYTVNGSTLPIAKKYGVSRSFIENTLKRNNVQLKNGYCMGDSTISEIVSLYVGGFSTYDIAEKFNVCRSTIENILRTRKIPIRGSRKYSFDQNYFKDIDCEEKAYWLGFITADGCLSADRKSGYSVTVELSVVDKGHLVKLALAVDFIGNLYERSRVVFGKESSFCCLSLNSKLMVNSLIKLGLTQNKSLSTVVPDIPKSLYRHFVRGVVDGDGSIVHSNTNKISVSIASGSFGFLESIRNIINTGCGFNYGSLYKKSTGNTCILSYGGNRSVLKVLKWLYNSSTVYLDRKYLQYINICG